MAEKSYRTTKIVTRSQRKRKMAKA